MSAPIVWLDDATVGRWIVDGQLTEHGLVGSLVPPLFDTFVAVRLVGEAAAAVYPDRDLRDLRDHLVTALRDHAQGVDRCTFAFADLWGWDGHTATGTTEQPVPALLENDIRSYLLYRGAIEDADAVARAGAPVEMPDLWWPDDRSWFVATDTDIDFVIVAGPAALPTWLAGRDIYLEKLTARSWLA